LNEEILHVSNVICAFDIISDAFVVPSVYENQHIYDDEDPIFSSSSMELINSELTYDNYESDFIEGSKLIFYKDRISTSTHIEFYISSPLFDDYEESDIEIHKQQFISFSFEGFGQRESC
jgi:hypothetical protein